MSTVNPTFDYSPRKQFLAFHNRKQRNALIEAHRRSGKTYSILADIVLRALRTKKKNARYAYIAPFRTQAKEIAWTYLKGFTNGLRDGAPREAELRIKLPNGSWVTLYGADNPDALRGLYFDGVALDEFDDMKPQLLGQIIMPTLLDRKGWLVISGTVKGRSGLYQQRLKVKDQKNWYYQFMPASQSGIFSQEELDGIKAEVSEEEYRQEFELDVDAALKGSYYAEIMNDLLGQKRFVQGNLYEPDQKVHVAADLGFSDSCAWWFWQPRPNGYAIIDYYENSGKEPAHYLQMLAEKEYEYQEIWLPHDARAKFLGSDRTTIEQFLHPGKTCPEFYNKDDKLPVRIVPRVSIQHGIDAGRVWMRQCWFDETTCFKGMESLRMYSRKYNENTKAFDNKPRHDEFSHGADAWRYAAMVAKGSKGQSAESLQRVRRRPSKPFQGMLQYKDGRIMTVQTLDQMAPLRDKAVRVVSARRI